MPVMHGFEFLEHLRSMEAWRGVPVIVLSAKDLSPEERRLLEANTRDVIRKGSDDHQELLRAVRDLAGGEGRRHTQPA